ncbi:hypothetical protein [Bacillus sp. PK3_68]|uniref:hypothetical protein n=1 Tax=Bacillus sp. PK3_68 TaxID=2027408 RepID=UPI000E73ADC1|nr:hypothetical protein [Bacillus sp. PK3_68]RJS60101.1 hypothetical protein CJ483_08530 [Bacillus sp. PK3_68]
MKIVSGALWVTLICIGLDILIYGAMSGIAAATGEKYWEDLFFKLGVDLGVFFTFVAMAIAIVWGIMKITLKRARDL